MIIYWIQDLKYLWEMIYKNCVQNYEVKNLTVVRGNQVMKKQMNIYIVNIEEIKKIHFLYGR